MTTRRTRGLVELLLLVLSAILSVSDALADTATIVLSSPEATIQTYFDGYNLGDPRAIAATFLNPRTIEPTGLGVPRKYRIVSKKRVIESRVAARDDLEIVTLTEVQWPNGQVERMVTTFFLRSVGGEWKIVGYASEPSSD